MNTKFQSLTKNLLFLFLVSTSVAFLFTMYSCKDDASLLGADLIPDDDKIECFYDTTLQFNSFVVNQRRFYTKNQTNYYLGLMNSNFYGLTKSQLITEYKPVNYVWVYKDATIDSIVLYLQVDTIYGAQNSGFPINVFELDSAISEDPIYYSDYNTDNIYSIAKKLNTGYRMQGDTLLVFPLNIDLANRIVSDSTTHTKDSLFMDKFKGICIIPESVTTNGGPMFNININSDNSKISIFYNDSLKFPYYFKRGSRYATYSNDPGTSLLNNFLTNDSSEVDTLIYLQSFGGVSSKIVLNNYSTWLNQSKYAILKAELIMPIFNTEEPHRYYYPSNLYFTHALSDSVFYNIADVADGKIFNGELDQLNKLYKFDISRFLRGLLNGEANDSSIYIKIANSTVQPNRVILKSGNNIKLKVTYSKH
jgi:hypothetical protein